jgi:hypothetical protein
MKTIELNNKKYYKLLIDTHSLWSEIKYCFNDEYLNQIYDICKDEFEGLWDELKLELDYIL